MSEQEQHFPDEPSPKLSDSLRGIERQFSQLSPAVDGPWQAQLLFAAGRQLGQQEVRCSRWKSLLGVASLAACLSALVTAGWLREARHATPHLTDASIRQPAASVDPSPGDPSASQVLPSFDAQNAAVQAADVLAVNEPRVTRSVAGQNSSLSWERQLDRLLARHLPSQNVIAQSDPPAEVVLPNSLPTLREFSNQWRESL